jgi:hypothetical protein
LRGGEDIGCGVRRFFYVALTAAAGISTFFTIPRLILAVQGGDGAPDLLETSGNAAINIGGKLVCTKRYILHIVNSVLRLKSLERLSFC